MLLNAMAQTESTRLNDLSSDLLYAVRINQPYQDFKSEIESYSVAQIDSLLVTDVQKKAFWINIYNAYTQLTLKETPQTYQNRGEFFRAKIISFNDVSLSLNQIEHGILRRHKVVWGGGYITSLFKNKATKVLMVDELDYRIHFALNCGAKSCPAISFYSENNFNRYKRLF